MFILAVPSSTSMLHAFSHRNWPQMPVGSTVEPGGRLLSPSLQNGDWAVPSLLRLVSGSGVTALWRWLGLGLQPYDGCVLWDKAERSATIQSVASVASLLSSLPVSPSQKEMIMLWLFSTPWTFLGNCKLTVLWFIHNSHKFPFMTWISSVDILGKKINCFLCPIEI